MNTAIHPEWHSEAKVSCACGNTFTLGSTKSEYRTDVCSQCHPFFTGQIKFLDAAGRVDAFREKQKNASKKLLSKTERRKLKREQKLNEEMSLPETLAEFKKTIKTDGKKKKAKKAKTESK